MKALLAFLNTAPLAGKGIILTLSTLVSVFVSMKLALLGLCILIFIDLLTGIRKTLHIDGISFNPLKKLFWKSIKSYLLRKTWKKTYEYGVGILVVAVFETFIFGTPMSIMLMEKTFTLTELSTIIPAIVEVWSIFENFEAVSGNNILKRLVTLLPKPLKNLFTGKKGTENYE